MLNSKVRNLAITAITIVSVTVLAALSAISASAATTAAASPGHAAVAETTVAQAARAVPNASSAPDTSPILCDTNDSPWPCIKIYGSGLNITNITAWAHNPTRYPIGPIHIELYYTVPYEPLPPTDTGQIGFIAGGNSKDFTIPGGGNSSVFDYGPYFLPLGQNTYVCAGLWLDNGSLHTSLGYACGAVHR